MEALKLTVGQALETEETGSAREEVTSVVVGMESDEVAVEDTEKNLTTHREDTAMLCG